MTFHRIGLYFGSFNPIHAGHLHVVKTALKTTIDKLYLVVSPQSPFKPLSELAPFEDRLAMAQIALMESDLEAKVEAVDWEKNIYPSYTAHTLQSDIPMLRDNEVTIFMGLDNFLTIDKWKEPQYILENFCIYIIPRGGDNAILAIDKKVQELRENVTPRIKCVNYSNPFEKFDMAATNIRELIKNSQSTDSMLVKGVQDYIAEKKLYI